MAGLIDPNDIAKARQSGYSDQEISTFLADKHPEQFKTARDAGYSDKEIIDHLAPAEGRSPATEQAPSGIAAGVMHGLAGTIRGDASTIGLTGAPTSSLDALANSAEPANYKGASLIREGGHWYNPSDYQPSALPQMLAEQAPGLAQDAVGGSLAGVPGFLGSMMLRTFGQGAHANADAATGVPNSPVTAGNILREVGKQALTLPLNAFPAGRLLGKVAETGLARAVPSVLESTGAGAATNLIDQVGTTAGSKDGLNVDGNELATSALTRAAGHSLLVAPRLAADTVNNSANGRFETDPETRAAAVAVANRNREAADGKPLVGPLGGTKVAQGVKTNVLSDIHRELSDAAKGEDSLSPDNANTLSRVQSGGTASPKELTALATEADPETVHLARQALISSQVKDTGGLSGAMDKLAPIKNPIKTGMATGAAALAGHAGLGSFAGTIGAVAPYALGALGGAYGGARAFDTAFGTRAPMQGFTDRFADPTAPIRTPEPQAPAAPPVTTSVPQVTPPQDTQLWGAPKPTGPTPEAQNADIQGMLRMAAARRNVAAAQQAASAPVAPVDAFDALKPLMGRQRVLMRGMAASNKQQMADNIAQRKAAGVAQAESLAGDSPAINAQGGLSALSNPAFTQRGSQLLSAANVMRKLTAQPAAESTSPGDVSNAPASPAISELMQKLQGQPGVPVNPAPPAAPAAMPAAPAAPAAPQAPPAPPLIAKITKKMGKPVEATPAPEAEQPYTPIPEEGLWRKQLSDEQVADAELSKYSPKVQAKYRGNIIENRSNKRDITETIANEHSPEDAHVAAALYHQLDTHSRRTEARKAIKHYTAHMTAGAAAAVHKHFTEKAMKQMWHSE